MKEIKDGAFYKLFPDDPDGVPWLVTISRDGTQIEITNVIERPKKVDSTDMNNDRHKVS